MKTPHKFMLTHRRFKHIVRQIFKETEDNNIKITEDDNIKITENSDY